MPQNAVDGRTDDRCAYCAPLVEAHHRVANHLAMISSYARLAAQDRASDGTSVEERLEVFLTGLLAQLDAAAGLQRVLAKVSIDGETEAAAFLEAICEPLARLVAGKARLTTAFEPGPRMTENEAILIGQFVAEAVANAVKHKASGAANSLIHVAAGRARAGGVAVSVFDDGPGPAGPKSDGLGGKLLKAIAARLKATLDYRSRPEGYEVRMTLPARAEVERGLDAARREDDPR